MENSNSSLTNGSVTKIGTETVGSTGVPIYLLNGVPTKASGIVNNLNNKPDWITGTINVTIKGNTDTTVIISPNISYDEIANMSGYIQGYLVSADWSTELIVKYIHGNPTTKKWTVYLRTNGDTEQTYTLHYCLSYTHS